MMSSLTEYSKKDIYNALKASPPFNLLEEQNLHALLTESAVERFPKGSYIFREGERSKRTLYFILEGQAKAIAIIGGEESVATIRNTGDFFGITVLLSDEPYPVSMLASKDLTCLLINRASFQKALADSEKFADFFTQTLASRLRDLYKTFTDDQYEEHFIQGQTLRRRVSDIFTEKVVTALTTDKIRAVAKRMSVTNVSSVVVLSSENKPVGIITEKDLVGKILTAEKPDLELEAHEIMSSNLITVRPDDFTYQALLMMIKYNINHIVVNDEHGVLHGIVTIKDLIRTRNSGALSIVGQIEHQESFSGLAGLIREVDQVQQALLTERSYASEICALITELYDRITRKVILLAEDQLAADGWGPPPAKYCFISMGSAGRKEQFSRTDQDNGIIFDDSIEESASMSANYFLALGKKIVEGLEVCGFKRCSGEVMADNPYWCRPRSMWKNTIKLWIDKLDPANIRNMTIFLDYRYISGEIDLYNELKKYTTRQFRDSTHALLFMAEDDLRQRIPMNMFGRIITEKTGEQRKQFNLKSTVMVHLVDCLRLYSLREGIEETNTFERIQRLKEQKVFKPDDAESIETAYESMMMFRIKNAVEKMKQGREPDNYIAPGRLTRKERTMLKESLLVVDHLQTLTAHAFHVHKA